MLVKPGLRLTAPCIAFVSAIATATMLVSGCGDNRQGDGVSVEDGSLNGEIAIYIADDPDNGRSETQYALRAPNGTERTLHFQADPHLQPGTTMKIWGTEMLDGLRVQTFRTMPKAEPTFIDRITAPLQKGMTFAAKRFAFIVVDVGGGVGTWTEQKAQDELTGPVTNASDPPTRNYYMEASYGTQDLDARAFVLSYPMTACNTSQMASSLKPMVMSMGGGAFNHYLWYFASKVSSCAWSGLGEVGTPDKPADDTWYNASASCVVMVQEPGHNFGMQHSSSMTCPGGPFSDDPENDCTHNEYGDRYDPMGGGCDHMNAWQKAYNGWLQGCNLVQVKQSGTFTLVPTELACDGVQALQIPAPKSRPFSRAGGGGSATTENLTHYYLELRTNRGLDSGTTPGLSVLVHVAGKLLGRKDRALHTWILDMETASGIQGLTAGKSFTDPAGGVTFTVTELAADHATIDIKMDAQGGGPTCMDGAAFTAPGPGIESCSAAPIGPGNGGASGSTGGAGGTNPGTGGRPGTGGTPGTGTGGRGGSTGTGGGSTGGGPGTGTGGRGGTGGSATGGANSGGAPSSGGAPGSGGGIVPGSGGAPSSGGAPGTASGGTPGTGTGGAPGSGGGPGITPPPDVTGGCACNTAGGSPIAGTALAFGAMLLLGAARKRRRK